MESGVSPMHIPSAERPCDPLTASYCICLTPLKAITVPRTSHVNVCMCIEGPHYSHFC